MKNKNNLKQKKKNSLFTSHDSIRIKSVSLTQSGNVSTTCSPLSLVCCLMWGEAGVRHCLLTIGWYAVGNGVGSYLVVWIGWILKWFWLLRDDDDEEEDEESFWSEWTWFSCRDDNVVVVVVGVGVVFGCWVIFFNCKGVNEVSLKKKNNSIFVFFFAQKIYYYCSQGASNNSSRTLLFIEFNFWNPTKIILLLLKKIKIVLSYQSNI